MKSTETMVNDLDEILISTIRVGKVISLHGHNIAKQRTYAVKYWNTFTLTTMNGNSIFVGLLRKGERYGT